MFSDLGISYCGFENEYCYEKYMFIKPQRFHCEKNKH